ncbi:MAG: hypothetical protein Q9199_003546 [Rusavskia elegans]
MHFSTKLITFVAASLLTSSIAAPVENTTLVGPGRPSTPPAPLKCTDPKTGTSPKCWTEVKVDEYMEEWHQKISLLSEKIQTAINKIFSGWSNAIKQVDAINPYVIHNASKPQGVDESIDLVLNNLITRAPSDPQNDALRAVLKIFRPNSYTLGDKTNSGKPDMLLPVLLQMRLADTLRHVETNLTSFLTMAANGTFTKQVYTERYNLLCDWVPGYCNVKIDVEPAEPFDG